MLVQNYGENDKILVLKSVKFVKTKYELKAKNKSFAYVFTEKANNLFKNYLQEISDLKALSIFNDAGKEEDRDRRYKDVHRRSSSQFTKISKHFEKKMTSKNFDDVIIELKEYPSKEIDLDKMDNFFTLENDLKSSTSLFTSQQNIDTSNLKKEN